MRKFVFLFILGLSLVSALVWGITAEKITPLNPGSVSSPSSSSSPTPTPKPTHPMQIEVLRQGKYPGSQIVIEETLTRGSNYKKYIASYRSQGLKIYGLLTIPTQKKPTNGFPTIVFLHGYVAPTSYLTTRDYVASQNGLAEAGFITFKPDFRGHGKSEGEATSAHFSEAYVVDTLEAISSLKQFPDTDPTRIGLWGHSNGGEIGLRTMVVSKDIKAAVYWAGVVGSFEAMLETYNEKIPFLRRRTEFITEYGKPSANREFWRTIDPYSYLSDFTGTLEMHHGTADTEVPIELSRLLKAELEAQKKPVTLYEYSNAGHNFTGSSFATAMARTIAFFKKNL